SSRLDGEFDCSECAWLLAWRGPQQHEPPWHLVAHLHWCAAAFEVSARETESATAVGAAPKLTTNTAAKVQRQSFAIEVASERGRTPDNLEGPEAGVKSLRET